MKTCTKCKKKRRIENFYKDVRMRDGRRGQCIKCWGISSFEYCKRLTEKNKGKEPNYRGKKKCSICQKKLLKHSFSKKNSRSDGLQPMCKKCGANLHLQMTYNTTSAEKETMVKRQENKCLICHRGNPTDTDHDQKAKEQGIDLVRSILCRKCNTALGLFQHDATILKKATKYMIKHDQIRENMVEKSLAPPVLVA